MGFANIKKFNFKSLFTDFLMLIIAKTTALLWCQ